MPAGFFLDSITCMGLVTKFAQNTRERRPSCVQSIKAAGTYLDPHYERNWRWRKNFLLMTVWVYRKPFWKHLQNPFELWGWYWDIGFPDLHWFKAQCLQRLPVSQKPKSRIFSFLSERCILCDTLRQFPWSWTADNRMTFEIFFVTRRPSVGLCFVPDLFVEVSDFYWAGSFCMALSSAACKSGEGSVLYFSWCISVGRGLVSHGKDFINNLSETMFFSSLIGHVATCFSNYITYNCKASNIEGWQTVLVLESARKGNRVFFWRRVSYKHSNFIRRFMYFNMDAIMQWLLLLARAQKLAAAWGTKPTASFKYLRCKLDRIYGNDVILCFPITSILNLAKFYESVKNINL